MSKHRQWVNVYEIDRIYGGPEEGGWWYDIYTDCVHSVRVNSNRTSWAGKLMTDIRRRFPNKGYRGSVRPKGTDYLIEVENHKGQDNRHLEYMHYE